MKIRAIALNTFREAVRDKILYTLLFFAVLMIGGSVLLAELSLGEYAKIIKDVGLAAISLFGLAIAVFVGIGLVYKEIERKTIYTIASKPVRRWEFLVGKYLGLVLTLATEVVAMSAAFLITLAAMGVGIDWGLAGALWLTFVELMLVTAVAILFGCFTSPVLSALFTVGITVIGKLSTALVAVAAKTGSAAFESFTAVMYKVVPDLATFDIRTEAAYGTPIDWEYLAYSTGYGVVYTAAVLVVACLIFRYRDFK